MYATAFPVLVYSAGYNSLRSDISNDSASDRDSAVRTFQDKTKKWYT